MIRNEIAYKELEDKIRNASPLDLPFILQQAELYEKKETREVIDEVYAEFYRNDNLVEQIVVPIFTSIADGFLESTSATRKLRGKGLTASRIVRQCQSFSYDKIDSDTFDPDGYLEWKNIRDKTREDFHQYAEENRPIYNRDVYEGYFEQLRDYFPGKEIFYIEDCRKGLEKALELSGKQIPVIVTGSFYLAGAVKKIMQEKMG